MHYAFKLSGRLRFSPSDLVVFLQGDFATWMDRWHADNTNGNAIAANGREQTLSAGIQNVSCRPDEQDEEMALIASRGVAHEKAFLQCLQDEGLQVETIAEGDHRLDRTIEAMRSGADIIYQGQLEHENFSGFSDFTGTSTWKVESR